MTIARTSLSLLVSFALTGSISAHAQQSDPQQAPAPVVRAHHAHSPQHETKALTRKLGLTPDQASQVEPILAAKRDQMQALRANPSPDPATMHQQMHAINRDTRQKLDAVLTEPQRQQLAAMHGHRRHLELEQAPAPSV